MGVVLSPLFLVEASPARSAYSGSDGTTTLLWGVLGFSVLLILSIWGLKWLSRRNLFSARGRHMTVFDRIAISKDAYILLVYVGGRILALGVTKDGIRKLEGFSQSDFEDADAVPSFLERGGKFRAPGFGKPAFTEAPESDLNPSTSPNTSSAPVEVTAQDILLAPTNAKDKAKKDSFFRRFTHNFGVYSGVLPKGTPYKRPPSAETNTAPSFSDYLSHSQRVLADTDAPREEGEASGPISERIAPEESGQHSIFGSAPMQSGASAQVAPSAANGQRTSTPPPVKMAAPPPPARPQSTPVQQDARAPEAPKIRKDYAAAVENIRQWHHFGNVPGNKTVPGFSLSMGVGASVPASPAQSPSVSIDPAPEVPTQPPTQALTDTPEPPSAPGPVAESGSQTISDPLAIDSPRPRYSPNVSALRASRPLKPTQEEKLDALHDRLLKRSAEMSHRKIRGIRDEGNETETL